MKLHPFFYYYGGKFRAAPMYPAPAYDTIIEPFAGAAGYSTRYHARKVRLYDLSPVVCGVWDYLIHVTPQELLALPEKLECVDEIAGPQEAKWLVGFFLNLATVSPRRKPSAWMRSGKRPNIYWGPVAKARLAAQVPHIRHWQVFHASYNTIPDQGATWFIDPPYNCPAGRHYRYRINDYGALADWTRQRSGQVIACEQYGATWLPFRFLGKLHVNTSSRGKGHSKEAIWLNTDAETAAITV